MTQAGPDKQDTRLTERDLAVIDADQSDTLRYEKETPGRTVVDVFGDLGRDLTGQIRADTRDEWTPE
jgi:hypothetical protein